MEGERRAERGDDDLRIWKMMRWHGDRREADELSLVSESVKHMKCVRDAYLRHPLAVERVALGFRGELAGERTGVGAIRLSISVNKFSDST